MQQRADRVILVAPIFNDERRDNHQMRYVRNVGALAGLVAMQIVRVSKRFIIAAGKHLCLFEHDVALARKQRNSKGRKLGYSLDLSGTPERMQMRTGNLWSRLVSKGLVASQTAMALYFQGKMNWRVRAGVMWSHPLVLACALLLLPAQASADAKEKVAALAP